MTVQITRKENRHHEDLHTPRPKNCRAAKNRASIAFQTHARTGRRSILRRRATAEDGREAPIAIPQLRDRLLLSPDAVCRDSLQRTVRPFTHDTPTLRS